MTYQPVAQLDDEDEQRDGAHGIELGDLTASSPTAEVIGGGRIGYQGARPRKSAKTTYLIIYFLINSLAYGLTAVPTINLLVSAVCISVLPSSTSPPIILGGFNPQCTESSVAAQVAVVMSVGGIIGGVISAVMSPLLGKLSDRIGRLPVLAFNMGFLIAGEVVMIMVGKGWVGWEWIYVAYAVDGIGGSFATAMTLSSAYVSDCNEEEKRNVHIGRIYGAMFIGISVGPLLSSIVIAGTSDHPMLVFYICSIWRIFSVMYLFFIPESLPHTPESIYRGIVNTFSFSQPSSQRFGGRGVKSYLSQFHPGKWLAKLVPLDEGFPRYFRANVALLLVINVVVYAGAIAPSDLSILYPQVAFQWSNVENNIYMSVVNGFRAAASTIGLPLLIKYFRKVPALHHVDDASAAAAPSKRVGADTLDRALIRFAIFCDMIGYLGYALSPNGFFYTLSGALAAFGGIGESTTEATLTKHVDPDRYGELMGGLGLIQALVRMIAPALVTMVYSWTVGFMPSAAFLGVSASLSFGVFLTFFLRVSAPHADHA